MADWQDIKTEYITNKTSFRKLADKYGLHKDTIWKKAKDEGWEDLRRQHIDNTQTKILDADTEQKVDRATKLLDVSDLLLQKVRERVEALNALEVGSQEFRHLSATMKDLKEIQMIRPDADMREQEARIANLRKQAEKEENQNKDVTITIAGGDPTWQS